MRDDATIDRQQVRLPNADTLGYGKWKAQHGDFVVFTTGGEPDGGFPQLGRVAGRIHHAPALEGDKGPTRDWLLVIAFSQDMTFVMERWVNPEWVIRCYSPSEKTAVLWEFMQSEDFAHCSADHLREWSESGYSSVADWRNKVIRKPAR